MRIPTKTLIVTAAATALALGATACGGGGGGTDAGGTGGSETGGGATDLSGADLSVGSKEFTEQLVLGQIAIQALQNAGATVEDKTKIQGTTNTRKALTSGQIDMYWEYTGTGWVDILKHETSTAPKDPQKLFDAVAKEDLKKNDITWMAMADANDTYAIATSKKAQESTGVQNLSDYAALVKKDPSQASLCAASEFLNRSDGWPGLEKAYGFTLPDSQVTEVDLGIIYTRVPKGTPCKFGEVFATDGRIPANDMVVVPDDKHFFVSYNVALTVRDSVYQKYSKQLKNIFDPISKKLTTEELTKLNSQVDVQGLPVEQVAKKWLQDNGFIS
ncbi:MAG TPA: glycine betaine ABC transporter substrate-binding protein [Segeticoccus sp.]|nr:glycine betaine ABC transporter substrate-binding protein [Segeticoccus sp.]